MEEDLRALVKICVDTGLRVGLNTELVDGICNSHSISREQFTYVFAKHVALEFVNGELSYSDGDVAMNDLNVFTEYELHSFALDIYNAFDSGEFQHKHDPPGTISWQKYTLPEVMEALVREGLVPYT
jgi:hypothetical protein